MTLADQLGKALTEARGDRSRRQVAAELGIAGNTLRELEHGLANPTLRRVEEVAEALNLDVELVVRRRRRR